MSTAWRKKIGIGIHHGGGLQGGHDATFGGRDRKIKAYSNTFKALTARLLVDPYASVGHLAPHPNQAKSVAHHTNGLLGKAGITPSGAGVLVDDAGAIGNLTDLATTTLREMTRAGFVLKSLSLSEDGFKHLVNNISTPVTHKFKTEGSDLMKLNSTREKGQRRPRSAAPYLSKPTASSSATARTSSFYTPPNSPTSRAQAKPSSSPN